MSFGEINRRTFLKWLSISSILLPLLPESRISAKVTKNGNPDGHQKKAAPLGSAVLRVYSPEVIPKNSAAGSYQDFFSPEKLYEMVEEGIKKFTGREDLKKAWLEILVNYKAGDKIAIKPNFNFLNHGDKYTITSPQLIDSVVRQLVDAVGVNPEDIFLYDLCKKIPAGIVRDRIGYPVNYVGRMDSDTILDKIKLRLHYGLASADTGAEINMRENITDENGNPVRCFIPKVVTQAQHLINMPLLTNHIFITNSGALKNHFGTVRFSNFNSYPAALHGKVLDKSVTDINQHYQIKNKTRIIIGDGLLGVFDRGEGKGRKVWKTFDDNFPRSIFISADPVAIDSVMASMVIRERKRHGFNILSTEYLSDAMNNGLGIREINEEKSEFKKIRYSVMKL